MAPPAGAGSCRTGRRPRSGACPSTVGDAAPVPGAPRDAHGSRSMCVWGDRPDGGGLSGHGPHEPGPPADLPYGPWTVAGGQGRHRPARSMDQGWSAWPSPHGLSRGPRIWLVRRMDRGLSGWSTMTVRPYMVLRVGRMIGPACGPLAHSHDVVRKRAGHADGPHAIDVAHSASWSLVHGPGCRPWPTRRGHDRGPGRIGLDGSTVDAALRARSARPGRTAKGAGAVIGLRPLYRVRLCQVLFYSSCRFLVDGVVVTNGNDDDHHSNSGT